MPSPLDRLPRKALAALRTLLAPAWWAMLLLLGLGASVAFHGGHPLTRVVARDLTNHFVSELIVGRLEIGAIDVLDTEHAVARDVRFYDAEGREVIFAEEVEVGFDLDAAMHGTLRFTRGIVRRGEVRLLAGETALPSLIEAFIPPESSEDGGEGKPLHAIVDGLRLEDMRLTGELLGLEGIEVPELQVDGRLETNDEGYLEIEVHRAFGTLTEPFPFLGHIDRLSARIHTDPLEGLVLRTSGRIERDDGPTDQVSVEVTYRVPEGGHRDAPQELEVLVHADPAEARILSELGYDWAELFDSRIEGSFRLQGDPDDALTMTVDVETEGGHAELTGTLGPDGRVRIEGHTDELALAEFVTGAPELRVAGTGTMEIDGDDPDAPPRITIEVEPLTYDGWAVPALRGEGVLLDDAVRIDRVTAPYAGGTIRGSGEVGFDGSARLRIRGRIPNLARDRNMRRVMPGVHGAATIDARLETFGPDRPELDFSGTITLSDVVYGELRASTLRISGSARGELSRPQVRLDVTGQDLSIANYPLGTTDVTLRGGPSIYRGTGTFRTGDGRTLELAAAATRNGAQWSLDAERLEYRYGGQRWTGRARRVVLDVDRFIEIEGAELTNGSQRLEGWGIFRFRGEDRLSVLLQDFDLTALRALVGDAIPDVGGRADAHVRLEGDILRPELLIEGALRNGHLGDIEDVNASYLIEYENGDLSYDANLDLGARGSLSMVGTGLLEADIPNPFDALEGGVYDVHLTVDGLDLAVVHGIADTALPDDAEGALHGTLHATGPIFAPDLDVELGVHRFVVPGITPLNLQTALTYRSGALVGHVSAADERGSLVSADGSMLIDLINLLQNPDQALESLTTLPWNVRLSAPPRRIGLLPEELRREIPEALHPYRVSFNGTFAGGGYTSRADVTLEAAWTGPPRAPFCSGVEDTRITATVALRNGRSTAAMRYFDGDTRIASATAEATTPLDDWLLGTVPFAPPSTNIEAILERAPGEQLPYLCDYAEGPLTAVINVAELFTNHPTLHAEVLTPGVSVMGTPPIRSETEIDIDSAHARVLSAVSWWSGERANLEMAFPVTWDRDTPVPVPDGSDVLVLASFDSAPLGPFVTWIPQIAFATGYLTGNFEARGPLDALDTRGVLDLSDGYVELVGLGQHLSDVAGTIEFRGNWARLHDIRAYDGDGSVHVDGSLGFDGWLPSRARFSLNSRDFPVRSEGNILATLTGSAGIEADISGDETDMDVEIHNLNVRLPDDSTRVVQDLDAHPDISIIGAASQRAGEDPPYPFRVHLDGHRPFWVRRNDFAAQVSADITATYRDPELSLAGYAELRRGFFEVFGKRFNIENGSMNFAGGTEIDPEVNLVAVHDLRSPPNTEVTVIASGNLSAPEIEFSSNHRDCDERAEIISMLVSGRCGTPSGDTSSLEFNASEQATDFLAGIAAGLLTLTARKEFGDVVPVIVIESGDQAFQSARIRAGFHANDIIPDFLSGVVQGAYIEGIFTAGSTTDTNASPLPGVLLELSFPRSFVTTGEFTPPNNWSVDITWEP